MTASAQHWSRRLKQLSACAEAVTWARDHDSLQAAWDACQRGDWMVWLLACTGAYDEECRTLTFQWADRAVRVHAVNALHSAADAAGMPTDHAAKLHGEAIRLAALPEITTRAAAGAASDAAWAARVTAGAASYAAQAAKQSDEIRALIPTVAEIETKLHDRLAAQS